MEQALDTLSYGNKELANKHLQKLKANPSSIVLDTVGTFYKDKDFSGDSITMPITNLEWPTLPSLTNAISSLKMGNSSYYCTVYTGYNYTGTFFNFRYPMQPNNFTAYSINDQIKSIKAAYIPTLQTVAIYKDSYGQGACLMYLAGGEEAVLGNTVIGNDAVSSYTLYPGTWITFYKNINFSGEIISNINNTAIVQTYNMPSGYNDWASSFKSGTV